MRGRVRGASGVCNKNVNYALVDSGKEGVRHNIEGREGEGERKVGKEGRMEKGSREGGRGGRHKGW